MTATLYVFAGPNGSGKSTIIKDYISFYGLDGVEYICPDIYASLFFKGIEDVLERYKKAMLLAEYKRERLLREQKSMIIETVLSKTDKIDFVKKARQSGFRIVSVFVGTSSPQINIQRVKTRVDEGGHDVPKEKIIDRYANSMKNLSLLSAYSDELYVFDNSGSKPLLAVSLIGENLFVSPEAPLWTKQFLRTNS